MGNVIKKGLLILLGVIIVLLIIWLVIKLNKNAADNKVKENNDSNVNDTTNLDQDFYSAEFIENYRYFHDTVKEFFLIGTLPENNKSITYTLKDLIAKGIILPFGENNQACDQDKSYVTVTNTNGKYEMSTNLVCNGSIAKTTEELGCNQLCPGNNCTTIPGEDNKTEEVTDYEKVTEYLHKQSYTTTETSYSCKNGYTLVKQGNSATCVRKVKSVKSTFNGFDYYCPEGTIKTGSGSSTKCLMKNATSVAAQVENSYSCPAGYIMTGTGNNTKCIKQSSQTVEASYTVEYTCPAGYTKVGSGNNTTCQKGGKTTVAAQKSTTYSCSSGTLSGKNCVSSGSYTTNATAHYSYYCPKGGNLSGSVCRVSTAARYITTKTNQGRTYNGCSLVGTFVPANCSGSSCYQTNYRYYCKGSSYTYNASKSLSYYSCSSGKVSGSKCVHSSSSTTAAKATTKYSCSQGTLSGTSCIIDNTEVVSPTMSKKYSCPANYKISGDKCVMASSDIVDATVSQKYSCPAGYQLNGTACYQENSSYVNPNRVTNTKACPDGYSKLDANYCVKYTTTTIEPTTSSKKVTKDRYQWSTSYVLEGWVNTGKTRQSQVASSK